MRFARFICTASLLAALSIGGLLPAAGLSLATLRAVSGDAEVPDCCKDGMCPLHHHQPGRDAMQNCPCSMSPDAPQALMPAPAMPAVIAASPKPDAPAETLLHLELLKLQRASFEHIPPSPPPRA